MFYRAASFSSYSSLTILAQRHAQLQNHLRTTLAGTAFSARNFLRVPRRKGRPGRANLAEQNLRHNAMSRFAPLSETKNSTPPRIFARGWSKLTHLAADNEQFRKTQTQHTFTTIRNILANRTKHKTPLEPTSLPRKDPTTKLCYAESLQHRHMHTRRARIAKPRHDIISTNSALHSSALGFPTTLNS